MDEELLVELELLDDDDDVEDNELEELLLEELLLSELLLEGLLEELDELQFNI